MNEQSTATYREVLQNHWSQMRAVIGEAHDKCAREQLTLADQRKLKEQTDALDLELTRKCVGLGLPSFGRLSYAVREYDRGVAVFGSAKEAQRRMLLLRAEREALRNDAPPS